jgi:uncharacterized membrane protein
LRTTGPGPALAAPAPAAKAAAAPADEAVEDVEEVEAVDAAAPAAATTAAPGQGSGALEDHVFGVAPDANASITTPAGSAAALGHLHPALVHLPIAWVLLWALVELLSLISENRALNPSALFLGFVTLASYAPAALSGLCRLDELASASKGYDGAEALLHRNLIFVSAAVLGVCLVLRLINWRWPNMFCRLLCLMGVFGACVLTSYSAHLGGRMVYGAEFLPF